MIPACVLLGDSDRRRRVILRTAMKKDAYTVREITDPLELINQCGAGGWDLAVICEEFEGANTISICKAIRLSSDIVILVAGNNHDDLYRAEVLDAGADSYIFGPLSTAEVLARMRAILRRTGPHRGLASGRLTLADRIIDFDAHRVTAAGREVHLTPTECELLRYLVSEPGRVFKHRELLLAVWGPQCRFDAEHLRTFIHQLRKKVEPDPGRPRYIVTEPSTGYRFCSHTRV